MINDRVVHYESGAIGIVVECQSETEATIEIDGEHYQVGLDDVERIQFLEVEHRPSCVRGKANPFAWAAEAKAKAKAEAEAEEATIAPAESSEQ